MTQLDTPDGRNTYALPVDRVSIDEQGRILLMLDVTPVSQSADARSDIGAMWQIQNVGLSLRGVVQSRD